MSLFLISSLLVLGFVFIFVSLIRKRNPRPASGLKIPPGSLGWPFIGETLQFAASGRKDFLQKFFGDRMKNYSSDVFKTSLFGDPMAVLCGRSGNKFVFSKDDLFVPWHPSTLNKFLKTGRSSERQSHFKKFKSNVVEFLKPEALHKYVPLIGSMTEEHLEREWIPNNKVKAYPLIKKLTFSLACKLFLGVDDLEHEAKLSGYFSEVMIGFLSVPIDFPGTKFNRAIKAADAIRDELCPIIRHRRSQLSEGIDIDKRDLLSQLLFETDEDGKFSTEMEIAGMLLATLIASHDTTSSAITGLVYYLADNPIVYDKLLDERVEILKSKGPKELLQWTDIKQMRYSHNVVKEVLRLVPPTSGFFRETVTDVTYAGYTIPKGWKVFWSVHTTHRNPEYFPNPDKFDPSRFEGIGPSPSTFVPFGGGSHMCPGSEYARLVILIFMHCLVENFRWEKLIPDEKITYIGFPQPVNGLPLQLFPHEN